ncbi:peptidoglycan-binding protein [Streptomyces sp. FIT100]|uniref:peptidoglycan-binding protein n=1 Tax=Streptomyces sp. FIT100 TaxID=2837956 RepID=UPI0021CA40A4|nr:peptidoglycan-binding protein [Streptomyces sp. FIT100]UUN27076.1 peptidoglycan-binding protein [Streptomyces sp. FIT100]
MTVPAFEEYEPPADCPCAGCARQRHASSRGHARPWSARLRTAARGPRRALVLFTAAGVVLGGGTAGAAADSTGTAAGGPAPSGPVGAARSPEPGAAQAPEPETAQSPESQTPQTPEPEATKSPEPETTQAPEPETPQGGQGPLYGRPAPAPAGGAAPELRTMTRAQIINRAKLWVKDKVPYSMGLFWSDGYRQDCSGYVSMAWNLLGNEWTGSLAQYGVRIAREDLQPGDILLFHNEADPGNGSHVTIFGGWTDYSHTHYIAYEQARPNTRRRATPMAYWNNSGRYVAYRYRGLVGATALGGTPVPAPVPQHAAAAVPAYPGAHHFTTGADNQYVTQIGRLLVDRGAERYYGKGPGSRWSEEDRQATKAFQRAQGWKGTEADGKPGPQTWRHLVNGTGRDIPRGAGQAPATVSAQVPDYPGRGYFRPGQSNPHVEKLGRQLVKRGFGKHYTNGPGPRWSEADRRNVEAFQRSQGWRGGAADGSPGPETWRRLFS